MKPDAFEWMFRVAMMVLAGLVSLSMLGAIDTMARGGGGESGFTIDTAPSGRVPTPAEQRTRPEPEGPPEVKIADAAQGGGTVAFPGGGTSGADAEIAKWLEVIAYVLFALTGLVALLALILWRAVSELRRR